MVTTAKGISCDIIKFIHARSFTAPQTFISDEDLPLFEPKFDVILIYRNNDKDNNQTFSFDIRTLKNLSQVLYKRGAKNHE